MFLRVVRARLIVLPLAVLFLVFSAGAAAAPDCHIEATPQTSNQSVPPHMHSGVPHDHLPQTPATSVSSSQVINISATNALNYELCFVVGFIVLLSIRFLRVKSSKLTPLQISQPIFNLPPLLTKNLGYLNLTHISLGVIRV
jgi:hypothetical protein